MDWIPCNLPYGPAYTEDHEDADSFALRELNKPGTLIEVEDKGRRSQYLIGHMDQFRGNCGHCKVFWEEAIVLRYAVIWEALQEEEPK